MALLVVKFIFMQDFLSCKENINKHHFAMRNDTEDIWQKLQMIHRRKALSIL